MFGLSTVWIVGIAAAAAFVAGGSAAWTYQGSKLETCNVKNEALGRSIQEQNASIEGWKTASDKATTAAQDAAKRASEVQAKAQASDDARRAAIAANKGAQTCSAAIAAIRGRP